jgi:hypothetical protein
MDFERKFDFLKTYKNSYTGGVSVRFCPQTGDVSKILGKHLGILSENLIFFKTHKNSYTGLLCIINPEYGGHDQEI